jgi:type I restriction enzyme, S subunit
MTEYREVLPRVSQSRYSDLPAEWEVARIKDVADVVGGSTPSRSEPAYWNGDILWATPTDISSLPGTTISDTKDKMTEKGLKSASTHVLPPYSVLMTSRATIGACAINTVPMATNQGFQSLVPTGRINTWYLFYRILKTRPYLESLGAGSTFSEVSKRVVEKVEIPVPLLDEQRKIASVLATLDAAIQKTEAIIEQAKRVKQGLMQDILQQGLSREDSKIDSGSRFGKIPESWRIKRLLDVVDVVGGSTPDTDEPKYWGGSIRWVTPTDITALDDVVIADTARTITDKGLSSTSTHVLPVGSVLLTSRASIGNCAVNTVPMATNQGFQSLVPGPDIDTWYLFYRISYMASYLESLGSGSTFSEISRQTVQNVTIPVPPLKEQRKIGHKLRTIDETIHANREQVQELNRLKRGLMQDLLTGRVRTTSKDIDILDEVAAHG